MGGNWKRLGGGGWRSWRGYGGRRFARNYLLGSGEGRGVPASAEILDELNAGDDLLNAEIEGDLLVAQQGGLRGNDVEIRIDSETIAICGQG